MAWRREKEEEEEEEEEEEVEGTKGVGCMVQGVTVGVGWEASAVEARMGGEGAVGVGVVPGSPLPRIERLERRMGTGKL